jgi:hypothetical protein
MPSGSASIISAIDGKSQTRTVSKTADNAAHYGDSASPIALPAANAIAAENFTNNGDATATATLTGGHTVVDGTADLYWAAGVRYGCTVDVTVNSVVISAGAGDALPTTGTACKLANQVQVNCAIDGDLAVMVNVMATKRSHVDFQDADDDSIRAVKLEANNPDLWDEDQLDENAAYNPYTGDPITKAMCSNGETAAGTLQIDVLQDSTP